MSNYHIRQDISPNAPASGRMPGSQTDVPVPRYRLYGEADDRPSWTIHLERLEDRCRARGWRIAPHIHSRYAQMMLITAGDGRMLIEGDHKDFRAGSVLMVPPHRIHGFDHRLGVRGWVITIETHHLDDLLKRAEALRLMMSQSGVFDVSPDLLDQLLPDILALERELSGELEGSAIGVEVHLVAILLRLFRHWPREETPVPTGHGRNALVNRYRALIEDMFRTQPSQEDIAGLLGVSVSQLRLACQQVVGLSPLAILHERILAEARRYLAYTALPVARIADELGFSEASYFTRFFTRKIGETPTLWRQAHGERNGLRPGLAQAG